MSIPFEQKYKIFLIYFYGTKWQNCAVHICTVSDTLHALQRPAPLRSARVGGLVLSAGRCSVSSVRVCVVLCVVRLVVCRVQSVRVCWGRGLHLWGIWGEPGGGVVDTSRRKNSKKAFLLPTHPLFSAQNAPPLLSISKIPRKNKKTPTKGLRSVLYLPYKP